LAEKLVKPKGLFNSLMKKMVYILRPLITRSTGGLTYHVMGNTIPSCPVDTRLHSFYPTITQPTFRNLSISLNQRASMAKIDDLPDEVLILIVQHVRHERARDVISLAVVSRRMSGPAIEVLYESPRVIESPLSSRMASLGAILLDQPDLAVKVKSLELYGIHNGLFKTHFPGCSPWDDTFKPFGNCHCGFKAFRIRATAHV